MNYFKHNNKEWFVESVSLNTIAHKIGTPCYVYSKAALINAWYSFEQAFNNYPHQINYAVKANSNISILNVFAKLQSGFDIVSMGELERVLATNCLPSKIVFSGVGKTIKELSRAVEVGVGCINIESAGELQRLNNIAISLGVKANIALRINPDVDPNSHPYMSTGLKENKFGVSIAEAKELYFAAKNMSGINIKGIAFHIGSQITTINPFLEAIDKVLILIDYLKTINITIEHVNVGGGLGVSYNQDLAPTIQEYVKALLNKLANTNLCLYIEPGRSMVAEAGVLLTTVEYIKKSEFFNKSSNKYFAIVDAAMNDLLRPALYGAWHDIINVNVKSTSISLQMYDIVGPVCETGDFLGKDRYLALEEKDLLMVRTVGAYGFSMSSNYNSRLRPAEIMVDGDQIYVIRKRESFKELLELEML